MVTVPTYEGEQVPLRPLPEVSVDQSAPIEAFGGGPSAAGPAVVARNSMQDLTNYGLQAADDAHRLRMSQLDREFWEEWERPAIDDPKTGAVNRRGRAAFGLSGDLDKSLEKYAVEKRKSLATDRQRLDFDDFVARRRMQVVDWANKHEGREMRAFEEGEHVAGIESSKDRAALRGDPQTVAEEVAKLKFRVGSLAVMNGWGPEVTAREIRNHETELHGRVLNGMLKAGDVARAKAYFERYGAGMDPDVGVKIAAALQDGDRRATAYDIIDRVFSDTRVREYTGSGNNWTEKGEAAASSWEQARERIKKAAGDDAELRQLAEQMGRQRWGEIQTDQKASLESAYEGLAALQDASPGRDPAELDPAAWSRLPSDKRDGLRRRYKAPEKNDDAAWLEFSSLTDEEIRKLPRSDYESKYWTKLSQHYRDKTDTLRRQALEAGQNKEKAEAWKSRMSDDELMLRAFVGAGLGGSKLEVGGQVRRADTLKAISEDSDASKLWIAFKEKIDERTEAYHAKTGKNPVDKDLKKIVADVAQEESRKVTLDRTWPAGNEAKRVVDLTDADVRDFELIDLQENEQALDGFYRIAKSHRLPSAPAGLSPREFYSRNAAAVNRAFLLQWKEPDLTPDQLRLRVSRILKGEE
jgi:hypothetical protein